MLHSDVAKQVRCDHLLLAHRRHNRVNILQREERVPDDTRSRAQVNCQWYFHSDGLALAPVTCSEIEQLYEPTNEIGRKELRSARAHQLLEALRNTNSMELAPVTSFHELTIYSPLSRCDA